MSAISVIRGLGVAIARSAGIRASIPSLRARGPASAIARAAGVSASIPSVRAGLIQGLRSAVAEGLQIPGADRIYRELRAAGIPVPTRAVVRDMVRMARTNADRIEDLSFLDPSDVPKLSEIPYTTNRLGGKYIYNFRVQTRDVASGRFGPTLDRSFISDIRLSPEDATDRIADFYDTDAYKPGQRSAAMVGRTAIGVKFVSVFQRMGG
jgi:hypothetical protein